MRRPSWWLALLGGFVPLLLSHLLQPAPTGAVAAPARGDVREVAPERGGLAGVAPARADCRGWVALTFDDGPAPGTTDRLLRILREARVPATFFVVGQRVAADPALTRRIERAGFLLANHSWAHADMRTQSAAQVQASLQATARAMRSAGTHPTGLMRPPYGALDATARTGIRRAGLVPVLWHVDSKDWDSGSARDIAARILGGLRPGRGNVVLQHDGVTRSPISVAAVPLVVRGARQRGYCFTALDERGRAGFPTPAARVSLTASREGGRAWAEVTLSKPAGRDVSVALRTTSHSARVGDDVVPVLRRVVVPAGRLSVRTPVVVRRDATDEPTERIGVRIERPLGVRIADAVATAPIEDVDRPPRVDAADVTVAESEAGTQVRFTLARASGRLVTLEVVTRRGSAGSRDYRPLAREVRIRPGERWVEVPVGIVADLVAEPDETFTVVVRRAVNAAAGRGATVTITDG